jgi:predicted CxxxxCH...CXXCH cytochrome family protein
MSYRKINKWVCGIGALFILAACSSGSGGGDGATSSTSTPASNNTLKQGIAVDPYVVGAVFQEVAADGVTILQRQSTPSDANGVFTFPADLTIGSTVEMKVANKGLHGGAPFQGLLRYNVKAGDTQRVTVTPLTTMLANGIQPTDAIMALNNAGFIGLTTADLYANPMTGLANLTSGVTDQQLKLLQAAMAVEAYMEITGNFSPTFSDITNVSQSQVLNSMGAAIRSTLSAAEFSQLNTALAGDPQVTSPITLGDMIMAMVQLQQTLISTVKTDMAANGGFDPAVVTQNITDAKAQMAAMAKSQLMARTNTTPGQATGAALYAANCADCHGALASTSKPNRTAAQIQAAIDNNIGGMSSADTLTSTDVQAIADALSGTTPPPSTPADGPTLYSNNCAGCHSALANTTKPGRTAADIQNAITNNIGNMGYLSTLTAAEVQAIAGALPAAPPPNPGTPPDGVALYNSECAGCHGPLATTAKPGRTATQIQTAITNNVGNMGYLSTLTAAEIQAIAGAMPAAPPPPVTPPSGATLYTNNCAGCHGALASTTKPGRTATQIQTAITNNVGNMGYLSTLTAAEVQAIAGALPAAPPPPVTPPSGATLYSNNCAGCHSALASTTKPGRTATQIQTAITNNVGNMGYLSTLTAAEIQAIAGTLPAAPPGGPDYSNCTACHGQPPTGTTYPNVAGRHAVHTTLPSVNNNCGTCHVGAAHDSVVNLGIATSFNAKSGTATASSTNTCSNVSCHGGKTTPVWQTGSIAVDTQCTSCHASGTTQYNSYSSGQHSKHISQGYSCTVCHNTTKLATGHFSNLATSTFEQDPAATIGGGSTSVGSYAPSATRATSGTCSSIACHGSQSW